MVYWLYVATERGNKTMVGRIDRHVCPVDCGGSLNRVSERERQHPYRWKPIGYRCDRCGMLVVDFGVSV